MRWSFKLFAVGRTTVYLHVTFFLLLLWVAVVTWQQGGLPAAVDGLIFIILIFASVVLHEFGHVLAARRYGVETPRITLLPIGGVASLERMPDKPSEEFVVALAGPVVTRAIAAVLLLLLGTQYDLSQLAEAEAEELQTSMIARVAAVNIIILLFNLIPAFPLDGGRMLRALLAMRYDRLRATNIAARTGQVFAVIFAVVGLFYNPWLLLIAAFVFLAADAEAGQEQMRQAATGRGARDAMITHFESLHPGSTADDAARLLLLTTQQEFPVLAPDGSLRGMVTRQGLISAIRETGPETPVERFMTTELQTVTEDEELDSVIQKVWQSPARAVAVRDRANRFLGYISAENATELFMLSSARKQAPGDST